jgi:rhodanese-related sulfurtransferase
MITSDIPDYQTFHIDGVKHISPENALKELQDRNAIIVDVREDDEYLVEFLSVNDVFHLPVSSTMDNLHIIPKDKPVITICNIEVRSSKVANMLKRNGFPESVNPNGGLHEWGKKVCHMKQFFLMHATIAMDHATAHIRNINVDGTTKYIHRFMHYSFTDC